jgi:hypothetical protein
MNMGKLLRIEYGCMFQRVWYTQVSEEVLSSKSSMYWLSYVTNITCIYLIGQWSEYIYEHERDNIQRTSEEIQ